MARYIDADIILARLQARTKFFPYDSATEDTVNTVTYWINGELEKQKDVAPVVHAHWTYEIDDLFPADSMMICSNCGEYERLGANDNYCGNCGAKMDEKEGQR